MHACSDIASRIAARLSASVSLFRFGLIVRATLPPGICDTQAEETLGINTIKTTLPNRLTTFPRLIFKTAKNMLTNSEVRGACFSAVVLNVVLNNYDKYDE